MQNEKVLIYFSLDINKNKITWCSIDKYANLSFDEFYDTTISDGVISDKIEDYNKEVLLKLLKENAVLKIFRCKDSSIEYLFSINQYTNDIVNCCVYVINENNFDYNIDYLTGVYSRNYTTREIEKKISEKQFKNCALLIIDLNNFKNVNDSYGHRSGDGVLRTFSSRLADATKGYLLGRYGGDEFIVFLTNPSREELKRVIIDILNIEVEFEQGNKKSLITCSVGGTYASNNVGFEYLLEKADNSLYRAKNNSKRSAYIDNECLAIIDKNKSNKSVNKKLELLNEYLSKKKKKLTIVTVGIILLFSFLFSSGIYYVQRSLNKSNYKEAINTMSMLSEQIENNVKTNMISNLSQLYTARDVLEANYSKLNESTDVLTKLRDQMVFDDIGILYESGDINFTNNNYNIAQERLAYEVAVNNRACVDNVYFNMVGEKILYGIPFKIDKEDEAVDNIVGICATISLDDFSESLSTNAFNSNTTIILTKSDGDYISYSKNREIEYTNILNAFKMGLTDDLYEETYNDFINGNKKTIDIKINNKNSLLYFTDFSLVNENCNISWRIITFTPLAAININTAKMTRILIIIFIIISLFLIVFTTSFIIISSRDKLKMTFDKYIDPVTNGLNLTRFNIDAAKLISMYDNYAVVISDAVKFKYITEQLGRGQTDNLLGEIYNIILENLNSNELVSRIYGDRYIMLMNSQKLSDRINNINEQIKKYVVDTYHLNFINVYGIYIPEKRIDDVILASNMARIALNEAKHNYLMTPIVYYNNQMYINELSSNELEQKAESNVRNHNFIVYYQAKRDIINDVWNSSEALVRWKDDNGQIIPPYKFIPLFEKNGFITTLDLYVFETVCNDLRKDLDNGLKPLPVSVNISRKHLLKENFLLDFEDIIKKLNIPANLIEFELTESMVMENEGTLNDVINEIHKMGCKCSIDDFGTGYSSLSMLTNFDFDIIKLDRSFFYGKKPFDENDMIVVKTLISLAHKLNKKVVAEGIEDEKMLNFLKECECDYIQGYYYAKPVPREEFLKNTKE